MRLHLAASDTIKKMFVVVGLAVATALIFLDSDAVLPGGVGTPANPTVADATFLIGVLVLHGINAAIYLVDELEPPIGRIIPGLGQTWQGELIALTVTQDLIAPGKGTDRTGGLAAQDAAHIENLAIIEATSCQTSNRHNRL